MSYTEIFKFNKDGDAEVFAEIKNAFRGAMAVWNIMDEKYLPPLPPNPFIPGRMYRSGDFFGKSIKEVWDLFANPNVSRTDRIVLGTTLDNVVVMKSDVPALLRALYEFGGKNSLVEQAEELDNLHGHDKEYLAIAWNQTSVNCDVWISPDPADVNEDENRNPYNILKHNQHWNLFEAVDAVK